MLHEAWQVEVGTRLRDSRVEARLQPQDVATELGNSVKTVYAWEAGTRELGSRSLAKLCLLYGVDPGFILFGTHMVPDDLRGVFARARQAGPTSTPPAG